MHANGCRDYFRNKGKRILYLCGATAILMYSFMFVKVSKRLLDWRSLN